MLGLMQSQETGGHHGTQYSSLAGWGSDPGHHSDHAVLALRRQSQADAGRRSNTNS